MLRASRVPIFSQSRRPRPRVKADARGAVGRCGGREAPRLALGLELFQHRCAWGGLALALTVGDVLHVCSLTKDTGGQGAQAACMRHHSWLWGVKPDRLNSKLVIFPFNLKFKFGLQGNFKRPEYLLKNLPVCFLGERLHSFHQILRS